MHSAPGLCGLWRAAVILFGLGVEVQGSTAVQPVSNLARKAPATRMAPATEDPMFNNLIESSSHAKEYKRRGSFLLFTGAVYVALFAVTGVVSIYAYDAHL